MKVFIKKTSNEEINDICRFSIISKTDRAVVEFLDHTKFNITTKNLKFIIPQIVEYQGWVLYCKGTIVFNNNIEFLFSFADEKYAVMKVETDYKNSLLLWNCSHPSLKILTDSYIRSNSIDFLENFDWLDKNLVGHLPQSWNCISTTSNHDSDQGFPQAVNFENGGPWDRYGDKFEYGSIWERIKNEYRNSLIVPPSPGLFEYIPPEIKSIFEKILKYRVDSAQEFYPEGRLEDIIEDLKMINNDAVYAVDGGWDPSEKKGHIYDPYMESFILGSGGKITNYDKVQNSKVPVVFRGITKMKHMRACEETGRDFYYIDTGYFGNIRKKMYHRITKNAMQNIGPVIQRPFDRLETIGWRRKKFRPGKNILLCPPSAKAMSCFGLDLESWMEETIATIKTYTDRPIIIRKKLSRRERTSTDTMEMALENDIHCLVTFNSIAASEALLNGKPAFTLGPNAAHSLSLSDLSKIEKPYIPDADELEAWAAHLAYCQFTENEMKDGTAWRILNSDV